MAYAKSAITVLLGVLVVNSCGTSPKVRSPVHPVRIALVDVPLAYLPAILADSLGFYKQEGLAATIEHFASASKVMQSLLGGSADVAAGTYEQSIQMAAEGHPVKSFVLFMRHPSRVLLVAPDRALKIRRVEDLKGAVIGVAALGSVNHHFLNYVLLKHGISPEEVKAVSIGTGASTSAAMEHGRVDAAVLSGNESIIAMRRSPGAFPLLDVRGAAGCRRLYGVDTYPTTVLQSTDLWLQKHPDEARRLARSIQKSLTWIGQHSPEEIREATPEQYRVADQEAELEGLRMMVPSFSPDGVMPAEGAETVRKAQAFAIDKVRQAHFDLAQTYTNQFVQEAASK
jgi:NitT/TauT family transport system substrate-binding protein